MYVVSAFRRTSREVRLKPDTTYYMEPKTALGVPALPHDWVRRIALPVLPRTDVHPRGDADRPRRPVHQARAHPDRAVGDALLVWADAGGGQQRADFGGRLERQRLSIGVEVLPEDQ